MDGSYVSIAERDTYLRFLKFGQREDKRTAFDYRDWQMVYGRDPGSCVVNLGNTTVISSVEVSPKRTNNPNQNKGTSKIDLSINPISFLKFQPSRNRLRTLRRQLRQHIKSAIFWSKCIDDESLCISRGRVVFQVHLSLDIIQADGNLFDATCLAAVASLLVAQRPEISVEGDKIVALSMYERTPIALQVNHIPISTTFSFQAASDLVIVDPSGKEEIVLNGNLTVVVNQNSEICGTYKRGVAALPMETIQRCVEIAALRSKDAALRLRQLSEDYISSRTKNLNLDIMVNLRRSKSEATGIIDESRQSVADRAAQLGLMQPVMPEHGVIISTTKETPKTGRPTEMVEEDEDDEEMEDDDGEELGGSESEEETTTLTAGDF
ncbi:hypothetical protein RvY_17458 [Ramazzottius varieornatus]|uniref:Exosome complex component RRP45 n=1 Tax=Ramazzottius varieornatus TaxID=947166 RepID=A0A1D1W4D6_RAMVA|nr:hypothetical protein RvY_17458 [Ramazzottius varieornatus]